MRLRHLPVLFLLLLAAASNASAQDGLRETFGRGQDGPAGGIGPGTELQRNVVDQQAFPRARCNDNTPAIFYYRPASRPQDMDKWVIHLQGGGMCTGGLNCTERWFSVNTNFGARNMSSAGFPAGTNATGIFERNGRNPFETFNHIYVHYCSSDTWAGTAENVPLTGFDFGALARGEQACTKEFTISFLGRPIFDAVIDTLRGNGVPLVKYINRDGSAQVMPDLDQASFVVLSGGSAGGGGVITNLDHLRGMLPGGTRLVGLTDSAFRPPKDGMDLSQTRLCVNQKACTPDEQNKWDYTSGPFAIWGSRDGTDSSCLTYHAADPHQCADNRHVLTDHVTTPYFVRMDLLDPGAVEDYQKDGIFIAGTPDPDPSTPEHEPLSKREFAEVSRAGILELASVRRTAHERTAVTPGAFAPACEEHDELRSNEGVFDTAIRWRQQRPLGMFAVLRAWLAGAGPAILAADSETDSICP